MRRKGGSIRTVVHLSDVHFGRADEDVVAELVSAVHASKPDVVAISGDLTQRARTSEFARARAFLDALPKPQIIVPGNHDVPLHNVYRRFRQSLDAYRAFISEDLEPFYHDSELAILGINTARSLTIKGGRINEKQILRIEERLGCVPGHVIKIVVTHHPFDLPQTYEGHMLVGRAPRAMERFARCGIDLLLAGHLHVSHSGPTAERYSASGHSAVFVQAGTACSTRERGEANAFNVLRLHRKCIEVETHSTEGGAKFRPLANRQFHRTPAGWAHRLNV